MATVIRAALVGFLAQVAAAACMDPSCFNNLTWTVVPGGNITFTGTCSALPIGNYPVTWCGFGISPSGLMFPAEVFMLQNYNGVVVVEDRQNVAFAVPACYPTQVSTVISSSVNSGGSSFTATWTRPITLSSTLIAQGYYNIPVGNTSIISAILYAVAPAYSPCSLSLVEHATAASTNVTIMSA